MEGSGDDSEPQVLTGVAKELKSSIDDTQYTLQHHLQETQETMCRGQIEMETLEKLNASQDKIVQLLMQMTHGGNGPNINANRKASGSHGGTRHYHE